MTDWTKIAAAIDPPIPEADAEKLAPVLDGIERAFRPLLQLIPRSADVWEARREGEDA